MHRAASTVCALSGFSPQVLGDFSQNGLHPATAGGGGETEHSRQAAHLVKLHFSSHGFGFFAPVARAVQRCQWCTEHGMHWD